MSTLQLANEKRPWTDEELGFIQSPPRGWTNQEIGEYLDRSPKTVRVYRSRLRNGWSPTQRRPGNQQTARRPRAGHGNRDRLNESLHEGYDMSDIKWEQPPPAKGGRGTHHASHEFAEALRSRPGEWAVYKADAASASLGTAIRDGVIKAFQPAGSFEATTRRSDGRFVIYVRFVGEVSS